MVIYVIVQALAGIIGAILLLALSKKDKNIEYGKLDRAGKITNLFLTVLYVYLSPAFMFVGMLCEADYDGFLGFLGWGVSVICASTTLACALGLGASVALRRQGKSKASFIVQFAGLASILLTCLLYALCSGNILSSLN